MTEQKIDYHLMAEGLRRQYFNSPTGKVYRLIMEYDRLVAEITGKRPQQRPHPGILKASPIWSHIKRMSTLAEMWSIDPVRYMRAQFEAFIAPNYPQPPMLYSGKSRARYERWQAKQVKKYKGDVGQADKVQAEKASPLALVKSSIDIGHKQFKQMQSPNPVELAMNAPNLLPAFYLLTFPEVLSGVRSEIITAQVLHGAMIELLEHPDAMNYVTTWRKKNVN